MSAITGFAVVAPSYIGVNEAFSLRIKVLTDPYSTGWACYNQIPRLRGPFNLSPRGIAYMDNVPPEWHGHLKIDAEGYSGKRELTFDGKQGAFPGDKRPIASIEGCRFANPGVKFVTVRDEESGVSATSNPIVVTPDPPDERIFWGDLHSQTVFSDGLRCPEELHLFARDEAFLDVFAVSDHSEFITDDQWDYFSAVANRFNHDRQFVTFVGQEWTSGAFGHRNIYYPGNSGPILRCTDAVDGKLEQVYRVAREYGALVIPHHSANVTMGVDWSLGHDADVERLCEVYSIWGNSERPASAGNPYPIRTLGGEKDGQHVLDALKVVYRNDAIVRRRTLTPEERLQFHQAESGPTMEALYEWLNRQFDERLVEPNSGLGEAISYILKHWSRLTLFLRKAGAPLDNNICESLVKS